jgi:hypothetical protein
VLGECLRELDARHGFKAAAPLDEKL